MVKWMNDGILELEAERVGKDELRFVDVLEWEDGISVRRKYWLLF